MTNRKSHPWPQTEKAQNGLENELLLERWVPDTANNSATKSTSMQAPDPAALTMTAALTNLGPVSVSRTHTALSGMPTWPPGEGAATGIPFR